MELLDHLKSLDAATREDFAKRCETSVEYLFQIAYGHRIPKAQLAIAIDRESGGKVDCERLLPDADWHYVRGKGKRRRRDAAVA